MSLGSVSFSSGRASPNFSIRDSSLFVGVTLLFLLMPGGVIPGGVKYGLIIASVFFLFFSYIVKPALFDISVCLFVLCSLVLLVSVTFSSSPLIVDDVVEVFRPALYFSIFIFSRRMARSTELRTVSYGLLVFIFFEFLVVCIQRLDIGPLVGVINVLWDTEKNWYARNTGTFSNPNMMGVFVIMAWVGFVFFNRNVAANVVALAMVMVCVFFSGSRTSLALLFLSMVFIYILRYKAKRLWVFVLFMPVVFYGIYKLLVFYSDSNPYMYEVLSLLETRDLSSVKTYSDREDKWFSIFRDYGSPAMFNYFFGFGPGKDSGLRFVDNEYIAVFIKYGVMGFLTLYGTILYLLFKVGWYRKSSVSIDSVFGAAVALVALLLVAGASLESFSSWQFPFLLYMYLGIGWAKIDEIRSGENYNRSPSASMG